jgi:hypothetical protein
MKKILRVDYGETLSLGNYQSIKPALSDSIEYDPNSLPEGQSEEQFREAFKEKVRQEYFNLKEQAVKDFIAFASQLQSVHVPAKK